MGVMVNHNEFAYEEFTTLREAAQGKGVCLPRGVEPSVNDGGNKNGELTVANGRESTPIQEI
ncbi:MAG: hypothetical protein V1816_20570 [Pseudomonadota bacterium]